MVSGAHGRPEGRTVAIRTRATLPKRGVYRSTIVGVSVVRFMQFSVPIALLGAATGLVSAVAVRDRRLMVSLSGMPAALDGFRVLHASDLHLGSPSLNGLATRRSIAIARSARPDLVCVSGDLRSRASGELGLRCALDEFAALAPHGCFAVRGNHDVGKSRDPFCDGTELHDLEGCTAVLLRDQDAVMEVGGARVRIVGAEPRKDGALPPELIARPPDVDLQIVLTHYPDAFDALPDDGPQLMLAGHYHGGQLVLPRPGGRVPLSHGSVSYPDGAFVRGQQALHVSRGVGTTFVPFRLISLPEVSLIELVAAP